ncbi:MAG: phosphatidylserine decarboxylase family protein [Bacteroidia bacterium]|nr:phosphatidylserine decarboxylase family protein [Bacteroidia bacterium]
MSSNNSSIALAGRLGHWMPVDTKALNTWLKKTMKEAEKKKAPFHPVIKEFQNMIESDPVMKMYFTLMFEEQPKIPVKPNSGDVVIKNYMQMLRIINHVLGTAPEFNNTGMIGFPINAILDYPMITKAGQAAFLSEKVNNMFKKVLAVWTKFLDSPKSLYVLNSSKTGWKSPAAQKALNMNEFVYDPKKQYWGFKSWNDFFIREFKPGQRPVSEPNDNTIVVSACEAAPFSISTNVKKDDAFWVKSQPYSLEQMLNGQHVDYFVGGTVYQAYLSAKNYHRWHSPTDGVIKEVHFVDGTYYAESARVGFDDAGPNNSQGYIAHVATRALIFIESTNKKLGMLCVMPVGMAEVSSCVVTVKPGQKVKKGSQIGYFQFGGSTHCVVFKKGAIASFQNTAYPKGEYGSDSKIVPVNSHLATT